MRGPSGKLRVSGAILEVAIRFGVRDALDGTHDSNLSFDVIPPEGERSPRIRRKCEPLGRVEAGAEHESRFRECLQVDEPALREALRVDRGYAHRAAVLERAGFLRGIVPFAEDLERTQLSPSCSPL